MNKMAIQRVVYILVLFFSQNTSFNASAYAGQRYDNMLGLSHFEEKKHIKIKYQKSLPLVISSSGINHISFWPFRVEKIIGDTSTFTANTGENSTGSELFITSKAPSGSKINMSIVLTNGRIVDLALNVVESADPKIVELDFGGSAGTMHEIKLQALNMIDAMKSGKTGKYYVRHLKDPIKLAATKDYKIKQISNYRYGKLLGAVLVIQNTSKRSISIKPSDFLANFSDVDAYAIENELILSKSNARAYVVFRGGDE